MIRRFALSSRLAVGAVLLASGALKASAPDEFAYAIGRFDFLPPWLALAVGVALPGIETTVGAALLCGVRARGAAASAAGLAAAFLVFVGIGMARGLDIECGCFGELLSLGAGGGLIALDAGLLLLSVVVCASHPAGKRAG